MVKQQNVMVSLGNLLRKFLNLAPIFFVSRSLRLRSSVITCATRIALAIIQNVLRILLSLHLSIDINSICKKLLLPLLLLLLFFV